MKERPILFSSPMLRAILEGRKTMTRRVIKLDEFSESTTPGYDFAFRKRGLWHDVRLADMLDPPRRNYPGACPYGTIGDRLWVRETWAPHPQDSSTVFYRATVDAEPGIRVWDGPWKPSIHMPRWASRINLEITGIRVERVQDISEEDARAEGLWCKFDGQGCEGQCHKCSATAKEAFEALWDSINAKSHPWASNPWVWVIEFGRAK